MFFENVIWERSFWLQVAFELEHIKAALFLRMFGDGNNIISPLDGLFHYGKMASHVIGDFGVSQKL